MFMYMVKTKFDYIQVLVKKKSNLKKNLFKIYLIDFNCSHAKPFGIVFTHGVWMGGGKKFVQAVSHKL